MHSYMLCGWYTQSEIPLTGVPTLVNDAGNLDVVIHVATENPPTAKSADRFIFQHSVECSVIKVKDVADYEIRDGRQIRVWPAAGAMPKDIEIYLFGQAWGTLCFQRGTLPLHASAIVTGNGITAFAGHSGAGKSTTAALLTSLGYEVIADDILPISFDRDSIPGAWPYLRRFKLHHDPIIQFGLTPTEIVSENIDNERYFVHPKHAGDDKWRRIERLYLLENDVTESRAPIEQITGADAIRALVNHTYHFKFILDTRRFRDHLAFCTGLASKILIYRLCLPPLSDAETLASLICSHFESASTLR
jgi:hypothetical protein